MWLLRPSANEHRKTILTSFWESEHGLILQEVVDHFFPFQVETAFAVGMIKKAAHGDTHQKCQLIYSFEKLKCDIHEVLFDLH
jgi:hypothetical protein